MKKINLIPTDKPSRLVKLSLFGKDRLHLTTAILPIQDNESYLNIHITSNNDIKPTVYCLINGVICKTELRDKKVVSRLLSGGGTMDICKSEYSEIILTTDKDLIKDGVQAIPDEFLEWFVHNNSCNEVDVELKLKAFDSLNREIDYVMDKGDYVQFIYEINFPTKEQNKTEKDPTITHVLDELLNEVKNEFLKVFNDCKHNDTSKVTRVEVIQHSEPFNGRAYSKHNAKDVEIQLQDDGKTLKIFLK